MQTNDFDADFGQWLRSQQSEMLDTLKTWSNINSGSFNVDGINEMASTIAEYAEKCLGVKANITQLPAISVMSDDGILIEKPIGPVLQMSMRPEAMNRVLFCGHMVLWFIVLWFIVL